ncbi:MAG TPA: type VI secretion system-associated FHA domain protein TagH [Sedimenticola sp.]|nr:type VI secretion system-associated FHA domain protein TagH [Sedimenticola sp.]
MELTLTVVRYKTLPPARELRLTVDEQGCTVGRSPDNDLVLPDPELFISGRHAEIHFRDGAFYLTDTSTNGTFVNNAPQPVGRANAVELHDGDRLAIGDYEIQVALTGLKAATPPLAGTAVFDTPGGAARPEAVSHGIPEESTRPPDVLDLFGGPEKQPEPPGETDLLHPKPAPAQPQAPPAAPPPFPEEFDLLQPKPAEPDWTGGASEADHTPAEQDQFTPPQAIPENYDVLTGEIVREPEQEQEPAAPEGPVSRPPAEPAGKEAPQVQAAPASPPPPQAPAPAAQAPATRPAPADTEALRALLAGLGRPDAEVAPEEIPALMHTAGQLIRQTTEGLMKILASRTSFKSELRIEMTTIRPVENNPLKFSVDTDDALQHMLFGETKGYQPPVEAVQNALDDILAHELAIIAGLRAALSALLKRFDPHALEQRLSQASRLDSLLPMARKAKCWDRFTEIHDEAAADAEEGFIRLFGDEFTRAYEEQVLLLRQARSHRKND